VACLQKERDFSEKYETLIKKRNVDTEEFFKSILSKVDFNSKESSTQLRYLWCYNTWRRALSTF
jgi:hypothetical protein